MKISMRILLPLSLLFLSTGCRQSAAMAKPPQPIASPAYSHPFGSEGRAPLFPSAIPTPPPPESTEVPLSSVIEPLPEIVTPSTEASPSPALSRERNTELYILMYHSFTEDKSMCSDWTTTTDCFREDLQWLVEHDYEFVLPSDLLSAEGLPKKAVMLTFDDGYADNYTLAFPVLQEFNAKAVISLIVAHQNSDNGFWLTWDMCREMAQSGLVEFGSHTYSSHQDHEEYGTYGIQRWPDESRKAYEERILPDLQKSIDEIEEELGQRVLVFTYPNGKKDSWAAGYIQEHFPITLVTANGRADISNGLYSLPRYNISPTSRPSMYMK